MERIIFKNDILFISSDVKGRELKTWIKFNLPKKKKKPSFHRTKFQYKSTIRFHEKLRVAYFTQQINEGKVQPFKIRHKK